MRQPQRQSDLLIANDPLSAADIGTQRRVIANVLKAREGRGVLWLLHRANYAEHFERVLVMKDGRIVADGKPGELQEPAYRELLDAA